MPGDRGVRVVVLGGNGFVGRAILDALVADGFAAIAASRRAGACDATDPRQVKRALHGADCVVNAVGGDPATLRAATGSMAQAATALGLRQVVHVSSMAVYGACRGLATERAALRDGGTRYGAAKIACEQMLPPGALILRPGIVYGAGGEQWVGRIGRLLRARRLGDLGAGGDGRCNLIHARDVGAAIAAALRGPSFPTGPINLGPSHAPRWNTVLSAFARAIGAAPVRRIGAMRLHLETRLLAPPLQLARLVRARRTSGSMANRLDPIPASLAALFGQDITLDPSRADRILGLRRTSLADGLDECAAWFRASCGKQTP